MTAEPADAVAAYQAQLLAAAKAVAVPVALCVQDDVPPGYLIEDMTADQLRGLVVLLAAAADLDYLRHLAADGGDEVARLREARAAAAAAGPRAGPYQPVTPEQAELNRALLDAEVAAWELERKRAGTSGYGRTEGSDMNVRQEIAQQRRAELAELRAQGMTVREAARAMGVSVSSGWRYAGEARTAAVEAAELDIDAEAIDWPVPAAPRPGAKSWPDSSACFGHWDLFYPPEGRFGETTPDRLVREAKAKSLCAACPVRAECLDDAFRRGDRHGVRGGLNEDERAKERDRWVRRTREERRAATAA